MADGSIGRLPLPPRREPLKNMEEPAWAEDGMKVWIWWSRERGTALPCTVTCAMGNHARIVNEFHGVDKIVFLGEVLVPEGDPHRYP